MTSVINFRFKNALQQDSVTFDGSVIQVGDIKRLIAVKRGLGVEGAQELTLFDSTTSEELTDETKLVPRSSLVLVKRAPVTRFKPLTAAAPVVVSAQEPKAPPPSTSDSQHDDFGGGLYSSTPPVVSAEEEALDSLLAGQAATWQREVRQAVIRGRGRGRGGRGGPSLDYRCPRCEAVGTHWLQDCPTQGDPAYDRKRVRPPIGIPLTRLGQAEEGGLVLPDGTTGTLVPNEDAFAQEILGLPTLPEQPAPLAIEGPGTGAKGGATDQEGSAAHALALPAPPGAKPPPPPGSPTRAGASALPPGSPTGPAVAAPPPPLAGPANGDGPAPAPRLPRGPPLFVQEAFDRRVPLLRRDFERLQDEHRRALGLPPLVRPRILQGSPKRSRSRSPPARRDRWPGQGRRRERSPPRSQGLDATWRPRRERQGRSPAPERPRERSRSERRGRSRDGWARSRDARVPSPDVRSRSPEPKSRSRDVRSRSPEPKSRSRDARSRSPEPTSRSRDARSRSPEPKSRSRDARSRSPETKPRIRDARSSSPDRRARSLPRNKARVSREDTYSPPPVRQAVGEEARGGGRRSHEREDPAAVKSGEPAKRSRSPDDRWDPEEDKRERRKIVYRASTPDAGLSQAERPRHKKEKKERKEKHRSSREKRRRN